MAYEECIAICACYFLHRNMSEEAVLGISIHGHYGEPSCGSICPLSRTRTFSVVDQSHPHLQCLILTAQSLCQLPVIVWFYLSNH